MKISVVEPNEKINTIKITQFKKSGKWYQEVIKKVPTNLKPWDNEFKEWLRRQCWLSDGFIVVEDFGVNEFFFNRLHIL